MTYAIFCFNIVDSSYYSADLLEKGNPHSESSALMLLKQYSTKHIFIIRKTRNYFIINQTTLQSNL